MNDETAITIIDVPQITPVRRSILTISEQQVARIKALAGMMADSQLEYRKMKAGDIFIKMMKGLEVGLEPVASMDLIDVIQGKPTLKPQGMLALVHGSGQLSDILITDDGNTCTVKMKRGSMKSHTETFSVADADRMKTKEDGKMISLSQKYNWRQMPAVMRKWRAISAACRVVFPDIIQGMYIPEELSPDTIVDNDGEIVDAQYNDIDRAQGPPDPASEYDGSCDDVPELPPTNENCPEVYACKFTHMAYVVNGKKYLVFANCDPATHQGDENLTLIRAYGRTTKVKGWLGNDIYDELDLKQYNGAKKTTKFIEMKLPIEFEYVEELTFLKAISIVGADDTKQASEELSPPRNEDEIPF